MGQENLKTYGAVEMVLGLIAVSLGSILHQVPTTFKKELSVVFIVGSMTILFGSFLVCGGRKPAYACLKLNVCFNLSMVILSGVAFGMLVRHVPYCRGYSCEYDFRENRVLVGGILAILITIFCVETLISLVVVVTGLCSILDDHPQSEDPERIGSTTSEPLCTPPQNQETPGEDGVKTDS